MVEQALDEMEFELNQISRNTSYEIAVKQNPNYVKDSKFRIKFLRAEYFQPRNAANRCVRYFEEKMMLFGQERYVLVCVSVRVPDRLREREREREREIYVSGRAISRCVIII